MALAGRSTRHLSAELDPWLVLALLPAMQAGMDLEVPGPVSPKLLHNLPTIQNIFKQWDGQWESEFKKINVTALTGKTPAGGSTGKTACFFSSGADSFYTILRHLAEIDLLIYLDNPWGWGRRASQDDRPDQGSRPAVGNPAGRGQE